jgi:lysophospholipase L1-like esterase
VPVLAAAVLGIEVELARRGPNLDDVELSYESADAGGTTALWIGDSTAYGVGVDDAHDGVASRIARERGERVVMLAVSGATLSDLGRDQLPLVAAARADRVYISVGANDVTHLTGRESFAKGFRRLLDELPGDADLVVLGVPDMGGPPRLLQPLRGLAGLRGRQLDGIVRDAVADARARRSGSITYVDIAGRTGPPFRRDHARYFAADGYHPSAEGYGLWAEAVLATVVP